MKETAEKKDCAYRCGRRITKKVEKGTEYILSRILAAWLIVSPFYAVAAGIFGLTGTSPANIWVGAVFDLTVIGAVIDAIIALLIADQLWGEELAEKTTFDLGLQKAVIKGIGHLGLLLRVCRE